MEKNTEAKSYFQTYHQSEQHRLVIGSTVGRDCSITNIEGLKKHGATCFQIMARFDYNTSEYKKSVLIESIGESQVVIHMPFYFHFLQKPTQKYINHFRNLDKYWRTKQNETFVIGHCKGINKSPGHTMSTLIQNVIVYANLCPNLKIVLENDAGSKTNKAPTLHDLVMAIDTIKSTGINIGLCIDTEHAYAAGDSFSGINFHNHVDLIHLNAVPKEVAFGKHLDRHSKTPLIASKNGVNFVRKILRIIPTGTPIILERTVYEIAIQDILTLRAIANEKTVNVVKKDLGQDIPKKRKIFF